jgi:hypothetical protein
LPPAIASGNNLTRELELPVARGGEFRIYINTFRDGSHLFIGFGPVIIYMGKKVDPEKGARHRSQTNTQ